MRLDTMHLSRNPRSLLAGFALLGVVGQVNAQVVWNEVDLQSHPGARHGTAMAYDVARAQVVAFGGLAIGNQPVAETWLWSVGRWQMAGPAASPTPRVAASLACDELRQQVVLHGGHVPPSTFLADTWTWDGSTWTYRSPTTSPGTRSHAASAWDPARNVVLLFGGVGPPWQYLGDTWEWDGSNWTQRQPVHSPPPRSLAGLTRDGNRSGMLLYGGDSPGRRDDFWSWDGVDWTLLQQPAAPGYRHSPGMAWDVARRRVVLFSGDSSRPADTWEWDGVAWQQRWTPQAPPARDWVAMVHDESRQSMVVFGGWSGSAMLDDTWEYFTLTPAAAVPFGSSCAGTFGPRSLTTTDLPWIGGAVQLRLTMLPNTVFNFAFGVLSDDRRTFANLPLPLSLGLLGMPGCFAYVGAPLPGTVATLLANQGGTIEWPLSIPLDYRLVGREWYAQALLNDPGANPFGAVTTNAVALRFGAR